MRGNCGAVCWLATNLFILYGKTQQKEIQSMKLLIESGHFPCKYAQNMQIKFFCLLFYRLADDISTKSHSMHFKLSKYNFAHNV